MKKVLLIIVVLAVVLVGWMFLKNKGGVALNTPTPTVYPAPTFLGPPETVSPSPVALKNVITYTDSGYSPNTITIRKGETVTWKNESSMPMWTASAVHPTHTVYPGTNITNCGTPAGLKQFDACSRVAPGQSRSFKFDNVGTWKYHNHLNASNVGTVVVK